MKVKNIVVVLLSVITVFSTIVTGSAVNAYGGLLYSEDDNPSLLKIVGISAELSEKTIITVPSSVYGKAVTKIDRSAFSRTANIQGFSFTSTLLTICDNALFGMPDLQEICNLEDFFYDEENERNRQFQELLEKVKSSESSPYVEYKG